MVDRGDVIEVKCDGGYAILTVQKKLGNRIYVRNTHQHGLNYDNVNYITESDLASDNFKIGK